MLDKEHVLGKPESGGTSLPEHKTEKRLQHCTKQNNQHPSPPRLKPSLLSTQSRDPQEEYKEVGEVSGTPHRPRQSSSLQRPLDRDCGNGLRLLTLVPESKTQD